MIHIILILIFFCTQMIGGIFFLKYRDYLRENKKEFYMLLIKTNLTSLEKIFLPFELQRFKLSAFRHLYFDDSHEDKTSLSYKNKYRVCILISVISFITFLVLPF